MRNSQGQLQDLIDGVDPRNPFFDATSFSYPSGFPLGDDRFTSPKVIVARSFPGPGAGANGKLPVDPTVSFHATHKEADEECRRLEEKGRGSVNPFRWGGWSLYYQTRLDEGRWCDWVLDTGLEPPASKGRDWRAWARCRKPG